MDSTNPYTQPFNFVDLLHSQQDSVPFPYEGFSEGGDLRSSQLPVFSTQATETSSSAKTQLHSAEKERNGLTLMM